MEENLKQPLKQLLLALADDKLILGHRNSDWTGLGPILEEDIAFSALAQDEIAHAQAIYQYIPAMTRENADQLAFGRGPRDFYCAHIVEVPDEFDWATALVRQFFCDHFDVFRLGRLAKSSEPKLAALAKRLLAEEMLHVQHADDWVRRLGTGTDESRQRLHDAFDALAPLSTWLFEPFDGLKSLVDAGLYPGSDFTMFDEWVASMQGVLGSARLQAEFEMRSPESRGGRRGVHTEHLAPLLDEMSEVYRLEPGAAW
jgi:ring-1,2-phenylacetyl-CoA epoxidase subunit PaaC